jgi:uncharacterized protein
LRTRLRAGNVVRVSDPALGSGPDAHGRVVGSRRRAIADALLGALAASLAAAALYRLQAVPFVRSNLHALVAAVFLFLPQLMLRGRGDLDAYGLRAHPLGLGLKLAALATLVLLPAFTLGFVVYNRFLCAHWPQLVSGSCWHLLHPQLRWPASFVTMALAQVVVVALPEELFFRGFVQGRLEDALPPTRRLFGAPVGWALILSSILFGLGHYLVTFQPTMLSRAIPGLAFGWLYARTRSILAGTIFHAACNLLVEVLASSML